MTAALRTIYCLPLTVVVGLSAECCAIGDDRAEPQSRPRLPRATSKVRWDMDSAPFDVRRAIRVPGPRRNGEALYLDGLFEFTAEVRFCFPEEEQNRRLQAVMNRTAEYTRVMQFVPNPPDEEGAKKIDALIARYAEGFRKIREAQRKPERVFESGMDFQALLPHAQGSRQVARVVALKSRRDLQKGDLDDVLDDVDMMFRLSRDLNRRGFLINGLVGLAIESIVQSELVGPLLASPDLTVRHCDRLLKIMQNHRRQGRDRYVELLQMEYISTRTFLHDCEHQVGPFKPAANRGDRILQIRNVIGDFARDAKVQNAAEQIADMQADDYRAEVERLNQTYREVVRATKLTFARRMKRLSELEEQAKKDAKLLSLVLPAFPVAMKAFVRGDARLAGYRCLTMLRRAQVSRKKNARVSLLTAALMTGSLQVPTDPYSGNGMKLAWRDNRPVVYSIGPDGKDDKGKVDWNFGRQPGDILFRLPRRKQGRFPPAGD